MARHISAEVTEKMLRDYADDVGCNRGDYVLANGILKAVSYINNNIPTAYEPDAVVAELEEFVEKLLERLEKTYAFKCVTNAEGKNVFEIIKDLTSEHNNDFCEWRKENSNKYVCDAHAEIHDSRVLDWCVCPYCGKKIKIITAPYKKGE